MAQKRNTEKPLNRLAYLENLKKDRVLAESQNAKNSIKNINAIMQLKQILLSGYEFEYQSALEIIAKVKPDIKHQKTTIKFWKDQLSIEMEKMSKCETILKSEK